MNKQQILATAKSQIDNRRFAAEEKCQRLVDKLRTIAVWRNVEKKLKQAQVAYAMSANDQNKANAQKDVEKYSQAQSQLLAKLGLTPASLTPNYTCKQCNDTGYVGNKMCSCLMAEVRKVLFADSNITNQNHTFAASTETNKHNQSVYKMAQKVCAEGRKNVLLTGNTGSGKTYLLTACANSCIAQNKSVTFVTAYALNNMLLDSHLSGQEARKILLEQLTDVDVLVIDDLGTENVYRNVTAEYLFAVLNERVNNGKPTYISTNLTLQDIRDRYDERIFSRLVDQSATFVAQLVGDDKRLAK